MPSAIGLDIGTSAVRAVQLKVGGRGPVELERLGQVLLPAGAVHDGEIVDPDAVGDAIRTLWSRYGFKGRQVALGVANQQVVVRQVDLPAMAEEQLRQSLEFQVQEYIPIPVTEAVLDFHLLDEYETEEGNPISRVMLVAAQRLMIDSVLDVVARAKLEPVLVDLDAFAMLRSLAPPEAIDPTEGELVIDIGASVTNIAVHQGGTPRFVRVLLMGGYAVTQSLMNTLDMSFEEAERAKASVGVADEAAVAGDEEVTRLVAERAKRFVEEIRGSLDYYTAQVDSVPVRRVVATGGGSELPRLREQLSAALRLPVDRGHPLQELRIGKIGIPHEQLVEAEPFLAVATGLALGVAE